MATAFAILEGSSLSRDGGTQPYHVIDLQSNDQGKLIEALTAGGLPQKNSPHPSIPGLVAGEPQVVEIHNGGFSALVNVPYTKGDSGGGGGTQNIISISGAARLTTVKTTMDSAGKPIRIVWDATRDNPNFTPSENAENVFKTGAVVDKQSPILTLRFELQANGPNLGASVGFVGRTNSTPFAGLPAHAWLCTEMSFSTDDAEKYRQTYEFAAREEGWLAVAWYIVPETGLPVTLDPAAVVEEVDATGWPGLVLPNGTNQKEKNGFTIVRVQRSADFNGLGLPTSAAI